MFVKSVETFRILEDLYHRLEAQNVQGIQILFFFLLISFIKLKFKELFTIFSGCI